MDAAFDRRMEELARRCLTRYMPVYTDFLDPVQQDIARRAAHKAGVWLVLWSDWEDAERRMAAFVPEENTQTDFPVTVLRFGWDGRFASPGHRDLLGALMAQGLERSAIGDIDMGEDRALVPVTRTAAPWLLSGLTRAGNVALEGTEAAPEEAHPAPPQWEEVHTTVAAPRLDAVLAAGWNLSRTAAQTAVHRELVKVDHRPCLKPDQPVGEGSMISLRGKGRLRILDLGKPTRSGRIHMFAQRTKQK